MPKRRTTRQTRLPRLTLLAWSRRDLLAFVEAVNALTFRVHDLNDLVERLGAEVLSLSARKLRNKRPGADKVPEENPGG